MRCGTVLVAVCGEYEQTLFCPRCQAIFAFFNLAAVECATCRAEVLVPLGGDRQWGRCEQCGRPVDLTEEAHGDGVSPWRLKGDQDVQYCGLNSFQGFADEVRIGKEAHLRIERQADVGRALGGDFLVARSQKKSIFFNRIERGFNKPGLKYIQFVHGYCNFRFHSVHQNAKFFGLVAGYADGQTFRDLVEKRGVVDIWLSDEKLREEFSRLPALARYTKRFRVLG